MEAKTARSEAIEGFDKNQGMPSKGPKLRSSNKVDFFICVGFQIGVANIPLHELLLIELQDEGDKMQAIEGGNTSVDRFLQLRCEVTMGNQMPFVMSILLNNKYKAHGEFGKDGWGYGIKAEITEAIIINRGLDSARDMPTEG